MIWHTVPSVRDPSGSGHLSIARPMTIIILLGEVGVGCAQLGHESANVRGRKCANNFAILKHTSSTDFQSGSPEWAVHFEFYVWSHIGCVKETSLTVFHNTSPDAVTLHTGWSVKQRLFFIWSQIFPQEALLKSTHLCKVLLKTDATQECSTMKKSLTFYPAQLRCHPLHTVSIQQCQHECNL